jgi:hypothetical protein
MLFDIMGTFSDLSFVIQVVAIVLIITWLYTRTQGNPLLFGGGIVLIAYLIFNYPWALYPIFFLAFIFFVMGGQLQFVLDFGVAGILQILGFHEGDRDEARYQKLQQKIGKGEKLSEEEILFMKKQAELRAQGEEQVRKHLESSRGVF